jgi:ribosomal protein S18 acetylase RimI-like enzyme
VGAFSRHLVSLSIAVLHSEAQQRGSRLVLTDADVGRRVSVRRTVEGRPTDALGYLVERAATSWRVLRADGRVTDVDPAAVVAAKVVPPASVRRGWAVPAISPAALQAICSAGWPARELDRLGEWQLRAHAGITGRANSAMAVGDPGRPLPAALVALQEWYAARGLAPLLQLPLADPVNLAMEAAGWARQHVTIVQVAPLAPLLATLADRPDLAVTVEPTPSPDWLALMHDLDARDPAAHVAILAGPPVVGFATLRRGGDAVGIGRVSVEGEWAGITSVDVAADARRQGVGRAVMRALLGWAAERGAGATYLQVRVANDAALRLYAGLGYVTHHPYCYRSPIAAPLRSSPPPPLPR